MCTLILLRRPGHAWPIIIGANRDEMNDRPWLPPARHWTDRPDVVAGQDVLAQGSWMGLNDQGVVAAILNRMGTLGPMAGKRSRGELVLDALDHADADQAARALADLDGSSYRPFNMIVADNRDAFWIRADGAHTVQVRAITPGLHMISAYELDDTQSPRIARYLPRFQAAAAPDPDQNQWSDWTNLLADRGQQGENEESPAMCFLRSNGFGTVSSSLLALPAIGRQVRPLWHFCPASPDRADFEPVIT